jgi:RNA ligase (TIGR02306 family)
MPDFDNEFTNEEYIDACNEAHKSERALATIREIEELKPIEGADKIEAARVDGWWVVVKKGEFQVSDLAVYFECDSFLPQRPEFEFLRKSSFRKNWDGSEGFRLKTIKLRGQLSQGLLLPILSLYSDIVTTDDGRTLDIGMDVTERLGVTKWEKPLHKSLAGVARGNFPSFIPKTDENRIQNLGRERPGMQEARGWVVREKLDGSSMTVYLNDGVFGVCSRNLDLKETDDNAFWQMARRAKLEEGLRRIAPVFGMAIQGELVGPGIQGNPYKLLDTRLYVFGIYNIQFKRYLEDSAMKAIALDLGLFRAPLFWKLDILPETTQEILSMSERKSLINHNVDAEGCVWRHYDPEGLKYSFKAISNAYLLKEKD